MSACSRRDGCRIIPLCIDGCPCPEFQIPPRTIEDNDAERFHLHKGCVVYHDGAVCPAQPAQAELPLEER